MTAANALMQAVLRDPADTLARLVFAEEIERDEPERAEYIRLQIKIAEYESQPEQKTGGLICLWQARCHELFKSFDWEILSGMGNGVSVTYRRGFPHTISLPMALLMGGECKNCDAGRNVRTMRYHSTNCLACKGEEIVPGLIDTVFSQWPVTEVRLTDREPSDIEPGWRWDRWESNLGATRESILPEELLDRMSKEFSSFAAFPTRDAALLALSHAIVDLGRERAGLPAIAWSK